MFHDDWTADINPELKVGPALLLGLFCFLTSLGGQLATPLSLSETLQILEVLTRGEQSALLTFFVPSKARSSSPTTSACRPTRLCACTSTPTSLLALARRRRRVRVARCSSISISTAWPRCIRWSWPIWRRVSGSDCVQSVGLIAVLPVSDGGRGQGVGGARIGPRAGRRAAARAGPARIVHACQGRAAMNVGF
jgi:hypothetical protein